LDKLRNFKIILADINTSLEIPFFRGGLRAGFPSPAADYTGDMIDLNKRLIKRPESTFFGIVEGDSMEDVYLHDGDLIIIDRTIPLQTPKQIKGKKVLCCVNGEFTIKFLEYDETDKDVIWLVAANKKFKPIKVTSECTLEVWGTITYSVTPHIDKFK